MISAIARKIFGSKNDRELKRMGKVVARINALEGDITALPDQALQQKTAEFRQRLADGKDTLDTLLPEAFAVAREAGKRTLGMRHFDVQLIGGMTLHEGRIAEMRTGEGKTLMATLPVYLNALAGKGVHVVTVNEYLAKRDARWMEPLYRFLGLTVGVIYPHQDAASKRTAYQADITYGTNNEFGFDFLRDNMALAPDDRFQRERYFAIVDEVDSILIDEARTPLIISGAAEDSSELYKVMNGLVPRLQKGDGAGEGDFLVDEKHRTVELTESGHQHVEDMLLKEGLLKPDDSLYAPSNLGLLHHLYSAIKAHVLFHRDVEYIVQNGEVVLIDEHTGRTMQGRRLSDGLHQAIEAKERVRIQSESQTLASVTFQNYFRLYDKLSGMTGTADTEAFEFRHIYGLDVVIIPTNKPMIRQDLNDLVYMTQAEKYEAVVADIREIREKGAPVLVGTASIESSEYLSSLLKKAGISHNVLNAKYHEREAEIVADAGRPGAVTIATNMAGRGTDIVLGGNLEADLAKLPEDASGYDKEKVRTEWRQRHEAVLAAGGLHIIGTERHESRRIDNQLRGRAGRQGDPGLSRFYLSMEDNLMRIFASDRVRALMQSIGMERGEAIEHRWVNNAIEKAQRKVEGHNFDIRKQLLEYDDVANEQRGVIYEQRNEILESADISGMIAAIRSDVVDAVIDECLASSGADEGWDLGLLRQRLEADFAVELDLQSWLAANADKSAEALREYIHERIDKAYADKSVAIGDDMRVVEKEIMLRVMDNLWKEQLAIMDYLRQGIGWRGLAGKNPKQEYKRESFVAFQGMLEKLKFEVTKILMHIRIRFHDEVEAMQAERREQQEREKRDYQHQEASALAPEAPPEAAAEAPPAAPFVRDERKVGRNEPCPCGSGKKYKHCHGSLG
ncbi:MAG: preprotein translocase subunit SecA [Gammaproteobacteria bacterium]|nr:MAG: preprotein translocase subunit SecA [Gammaproteobacteria bacterium]